MDYNLFDQNVKQAHDHCWDSVHVDNTVTWWFDNGELCTRPEWHKEI